MEISDAKEPAPKPARLRKQRQVVAGLLNQLMMTSYKQGLRDQSCFRSTNSLCSGPLNLVDFSSVPVRKRTSLATGSCDLSGTGSAVRTHCSA